jgi:hypothetical protein
MSEKDEDLMGARIVIVVIMILSSCFVFLPFTKRCSRDKNESKTICKKIFFTVSACFAAGLLMSISILHILPEANEMYEGVLAKWETEEEAAEHALEAAEHAAELASGVSHAGETAEEHDKHEGEEHGGHAFPLPFVLFQVGFFLMLLMNLVFHQAHGEKGDDVQKISANDNII